MKAIAVATPAFVAVMTLSHAHPVFDLYSRRMIDLGEVLYLLLLWVPMMIYLAMPMILALAIGCAYAVSMQDREIAVLNAAGVSSGRLVMPGLFAAIAGAVLCGSMSLYVMPEAFREFRERTFLAEKNIGPRALRENQFNEIRPGVDIYFEERLSGNRIRNVIVFLREDGALTAITGKMATFTRMDRRLNIAFHDGLVTKTPPVPAPGSDPSVVRFTTYVQELAREYSQEDLAERGLGFYERHLHQLLWPPAAEKLAPVDRAGWVIEGYKRQLHPILSLAYALAAIAIALGAGYGRRTGMTEVLLRIMAFLIAVHPAYLVGIGVLAREPAIDGRIVFAFPAIVALAALWLLVRLDRRQALRSWRSGLEPLPSMARGRMAAG